MGLLYTRGNEALRINPPAGDQHLNTHGSNWLWAVMAIFIVSYVRATVRLGWPFLAMLC